MLKHPQRIIRATPAGMILLDKFVQRRRNIIKRASYEDPSYGKTEKDKSESEDEEEDELECEEMTISGVVYLVADNGNVYSNDDINDYIGRYDKSKNTINRELPEI